MIPHLMNCAHSGEGWCLDCVGATHQKLALERDHSNWLQGECDKAVDALYARNGEFAAALEELRSDWQHQKIEAIDPSESLYPDQQGHNSMVESFVEDLDATITKLGLAPGKDGANG